MTPRRARSRAVAFWLVFAAGCARSADAPPADSQRLPADGGHATPSTTWTDSASRAGGATGGTPGSPPAVGDRVSGTWQEGDASSSWSAVIAPGHLAVIEEQATFGEDGTAVRVYFFDAQQRLTRVAERREQTVRSGNASPAAQVTELGLDVTPDGRTVATKSVDGTTAPVQPYEIDNLRAHAAALVAQARARAGLPPLPRTP